MNDETARKRPARWWVFVVLLTAGMALPFLIEVGQIPWQCTFKRLIGIGCPGCGLTRSVFALVHGDIAESLRFHVFGPLALLGGLGLWGYYTTALIRGRESFNLWGRGFTLTAILLLIGMIVYWVVRLCLNTVP